MNKQQNYQEIYFKNCFFIKYPEFITPTTLFFCIFGIETIEDLLQTLKSQPKIRTKK